MSIDQRGFVYIAQAEAAEFLQPQQVMYNQTINLIEYGEDIVTVHTTSGMTFTADHVLCTFSVGVLQNTDVAFQPPLPDWKIEAINSIEMVSRVWSLNLNLNLDTYCAPGYLHKDFPSVQRDFLVPHGGNLYLAVTISLIHTASDGIVCSRAKRTVSRLAKLGSRRILPRFWHNLCHGHCKWILSRDDHRSHVVSGRLVSLRRAAHS
jgi:hypothetical protein